jgi:GTP-binding protein HflX
LIQAFQSTLEEAVFADLLIHVVDASSPQVMAQMAVVYETLTTLGAKDKTIITAFNKIDKEGVDLTIKDIHDNPSVYISAVTGEGLDTLLEKIDQEINQDKIFIMTTIPYDKGSVLQIIREQGQIKLERYDEDGTYIEAYLDEALVNKFQLR